MSDVGSSSTTGGTFSHEAYTEFWEGIQGDAKVKRRASDEKEIAQAIEAWVIIEDLQSVAGQALNGKLGKLLKNQPNEEGRYPIKVEGSQTSGKLLKRSNFRHVTREDLAETYLLPEHAIKFYPKLDSMFTKCGRNGNAPALALCGCPVVVKRLDDGSDMDNQWATWMMINPSDGFAPSDWQCRVGRTLVYRPGGLDLGRDDMCAINEFLGHLLDHYGEEPGFDPRTWLNPDWFQKFVLSTTNDVPAHTRVFNIVD